MRACIIGAGASGIAAAKTLHQDGVDFDCFEASDRIGGNWAFGNPNGVSSAYSTLHINTSKRRMEFSDFPMPDAYPDFPRHDQIAAYFEAYVDEFEFRDRISFETTVEHVEPAGDGSWRARTSDGRVRTYDAVLVANGHHWDPQWPDPEFPGSGSFAGVQIHSHQYKDPEQLRGRRVVVLGMGNSAMDIAVDASYIAESTVLAARRGAHVIPKYLFGRPYDALGASERIPFWVRKRLFQVLLRVAVGDMRTYGLPEPDHTIAHAHPTMTGRLHDRLVHGAIDVRPNIERLDGTRVHFTDGTSVEADLVVYCTGYGISFPFFDPGLVSAPENRLRLFKRVLHPDLDGLAFIGLVQPLGAVMPIAERQSQLVSALLQGEYAMPTRGDMHRDARRDEQRLERRYVASRRHTIQVDFEPYMAALQRELRAGRARRERGAGRMLAAASERRVVAAA